MAANDYHHHACLWKDPLNNHNICAYLIVKLPMKKDWQATEYKKLTLVDFA